MSSSVILSEENLLTRVGMGSFHFAEFAAPAVIRTVMSVPSSSNIGSSNVPSAADVQIHEIYGAREGDILCYSGAAGDVTGDGVADLLINEMLGDGSVSEDVGNLLVIDANVLFNRVIFADGFESP